MTPSDRPSGLNIAAIRLSVRTLRLAQKRFI